MSQIPGQDGLIAIHEAKTIHKLSFAVFDFIKRHIPCQLVFVAFRPLEFELPCLASDPKYKPVLDRYIESEHKIDIWLKRSPVHPRVTVVRHSDYTPYPILVRTNFYKRILRRLDSEHGVSLVVWRSTTWLATFTVFLNREQGDLKEDGMAFLRSLQPHVALAVKRIATRQEEILTERSFNHVVEHSAQGIIVLDWGLNQVYSNRSARSLTRRWSGQVTPRSHSILLIPSDIREALIKMVPAVQAAKSNRPFTPRYLDLRVLVNRGGERLTAKITFIPAKTLTVSKGSFLIVITEVGASGPFLLPRFDKLTRRQAECVKYVSAGMSNPAIAKKMGTSANTVRNQLSEALRKLGLKNRYQVAAAVIKSNRAA